MSLPIGVETPDRVLNKGEHACHEWVVTHNGRGFRCGYVKVSSGHPWHGVESGCDVYANVHGGITFSEADVDCGKDGEDNGWWVGFDCAHLYDAPDHELPCAHLKILFEYTAGSPGHVRSQAYAEAECRELCEQAAERSS